MALKIRLQRHGTSHRPFYRMVVAEASARRDGRFVELLGTYEPQASRPENELNLKLDRIDYWKSVGAKATDTANSLVRKARREQDGAVAVKENAGAEINVQAAVEAEAEVVTEAPEAVAAESSDSDVASEASAEACSLDSAEASESEVNLAEEAESSEAAVPAEESEESTPSDSEASPEAS